jgi:thioredoxin 1
LDSYTSWCGPCKYLKASIFPDKNLGKFMNQKFISVAVDMEVGEGIELSEKYPLDAYPTLFFMDANGKVKKTYVGVPRGGAPELLAFAKGIAK